MRSQLKLWSFLGAFLMLLMTSESASANDVYLSQSGGGTGSSCSSPLAVSYFNTSSNWSSTTPSGTKIGPGTVVHLCGTITTELYAQGGGASGNVLTIQFETGASIQISPGADSNGAVNLGYSYIVIDGGANQPCGWNTATNASEGSCNGQIENMLYGSSDATCPGGACTTQATTGNLIQANGSGSNIEIRNLQVGPSYIHTSTGNGGNDTGGTGCLSIGGGSNWNIHDNKFHDGSWCTGVTFASGTVSNISMTNNEFYNNSHMVALAGAGSGNLSGFTFSGNYIHDMHMWDTSSDTWHADAIHLYGGSGTAQNITINNNIFGGNTGADITGQLFFEAEGATQNAAIFNNLFNITTNPNTGASDYLWGPAQCSSCYFYNNTLNGVNTNVSLGYSTYTVSAPVENNIIEGAGTLFNISTTYVSLSPFDYNAYGPASSSNIWYCHGSSYSGSQFSSWQSACGEGSHSFYNSSSLGLDSSLRPTSGSPVIGAGVNVCTANPTFCTSYPQIKNDLAGNARPTSAAWDIGAYNGTATAPTPPIVNTAVAH